MLTLWWWCPIGRIDAEINVEVEFQIFVPDNGRILCDVINQFGSWCVIDRVK